MAPATDSYVDLCLVVMRRRALRWEWKWMPTLWEPFAFMQCVQCGGPLPCFRYACWPLMVMA